jgi:hypothetical protein
MFDRSGGLVEQATHNGAHTECVKCGFLTVRGETGDITWASGRQKGALRSRLWFSGPNSEAGSGLPTTERGRGSEVVVARPGSIERGRGQGRGRRSGLGRGDRDLGAAGAGMAGHQPVGEEAAAMGVVLARAGAPGRLLGAVRDGAVTMHDQLSGTAPHPSPPHRRGRHLPAESPSDPGPAGEVLGPASAHPGAFLRRSRNVSPISRSGSRSGRRPSSEVP